MSSNPARSTSIRPGGELSFIVEFHESAPDGLTAELVLTLEDGSRGDDSTRDEAATRWITLSESRRRSSHTIEVCGIVPQVTAGMYVVVRIDLKYQGVAKQAGVPVRGPRIFVESGPPFTWPEIRTLKCEPTKPRS